MNYQDISNIYSSNIIPSNYTTINPYINSSNIAPSNYTTINTYTSSTPITSQTSTISEQFGLSETFNNLNITENMTGTGTVTTYEMGTTYGMGSYGLTAMNGMGTTYETLGLTGMGTGMGTSTTYGMSGMTGMTGTIGMTGTLGMTGMGGMTGIGGMTGNITGINDNLYDKTKLHIKNDKIYFESISENGDRQYIFSYNGVTHQAILKINPETDEPYANTKFMNLIKYILDISNNESDAYIKSICNKIIMKDKNIYNKLKNKIKITI
jgi:hypothetical protein